MEYQAKSIKNIIEGEHLANMGPIQQVSEYANCWVITVKTEDNQILAMKYPKYIQLVIECR